MRDASCAPSVSLSNRYPFFPSSFLFSAAYYYWHRFASGIMATEIALYLAGAAAFLRNGGHSR